MIDYIFTISNTKFENEEREEINVNLKKNEEVNRKHQQQQQKKFIV